MDEAESDIGPYQYLTKRKKEKSNHSPHTIGRSGKANLSFMSLCAAILGSIITWRANASPKTAAPEVTQPSLESWR